MESFHVLEVVFVGEQDGAPERDLKSRLISYFQTEPQVTVAYLVRVRYGTEETKVALCLVAEEKAK